VLESIWKGLKHGDWNKWKIEKLKIG
jgi:hypothetical protein